MTDSKITDEMFDELYETFASLKTPEDVKVFLDDVCTYKEVEQMAQRVTAARLLLENNTYAKVIEQTDISSATLSRVSRCIQHGSGGYRKFIKTK
ncbi:MAG: YerC/YecD family TrpR-related protein [Eubacteriales bacterium]|nr:YerC/YecD family TrpR-related protein [Christensenellaceae bacterium]MDY2751205.1 YerC/YecD family TrpR-related protein [Eubacteriales bacterium]MCI7583743.1 YerC/YecD family TrpR-related protein [Christensenellaceae bacterium]MCI7769719.1 YerC/YecD family TrpR-related protein [Christensenellaceae bacterium]MDD6361371.1 YerC/YecD family TrpR-related protein [Christensenellaceae bacterium]